MTDEEKVKAVSDIYSEATLNAKRSIVEARGAMFIPNADAGAKIEEYQSAGFTEKQAYNVYYAYKDAIGKVNTSGSPTQLEETKAISSMDLTQVQKGQLWQVQNADSKPQNNPFTGTLAQAKVSSSAIVSIMEFESTAKADKDANGDSISGSKKQKVVAYARSLGLSASQINAVCAQYGWSPITNSLNIPTGKFTMP
jgi:hypothetical protein